MCSYFFIGKCIAKKWTNIKDCWMKYNRLQTNNLVSGAATTTKRKYIYYEQMRFLKKISTPADTDSSLATTESAEQDNSFVRPATSATKRKRNVVPPTDDIDKKILHILEKSDKTESPHISFFRGILPSLEQLNTDQVLDFQAGVLQLLKQIKNCNPIASQMNYMHPSSSQFHNIPNTSFPNLTPLNSVSQASSISLTSSCNPNSTLPLQSPASDYSYSVSSNESEIDLQLL